MQTLRQHCGFIMVTMDAWHLGIRFDIHVALMHICREGDVTGKQAAGPVAFVLKGAPHPRFSRRGADLLHNVKLPLWQALVGGAVPVLTLDNR